MGWCAQGQVYASYMLAV